MRQTSAAGASKPGDLDVAGDDVAVGGTTVCTAVGAIVGTGVGVGAITVGDGTTLTCDRS